MNGAVDFSNPYCVLQTNSDFEGHGVVGYIPFLGLGLAHRCLLPALDFYHWPRQ